MDQTNLGELQERIRRFENRLRSNSGQGFQQTYATSNGSIQTTKVNGVKTRDEFRDEIASLAVWIWSQKDYLKEIAVTNSKDPKVVENHVNSRWNLQVVSDLANGLKHGKLRESRSNLFAKLREADISIPGESLAKVTFQANEIIFDVKHVEQVEFSARVEDRDGNDLGDVVEILKCATEDWNDLLPLLT